MQDDKNPLESSLMAGRIVAGVMGFVFAGIGLTVLIFMWGAPFGEFHSPPLFFRIFASFIAIAFVAVGGGSAYAAITGARHLQLPNRSAHVPGGVPPAANPPARREASGAYVCPRCGAALGKADVSPMGDVKCEFCKGWFNIHASSPA